MKNKLAFVLCLLVLLAVGMFNSVSAENNLSLVKTASYEGNGPRIRADRYKRMLAPGKPNVVWGPCNAKIKMKGKKVVDYIGVKSYENKPASRRCAYKFMLKKKPAYGACEMVTFVWPGGGTDQIKYCSYRYY